MAQRNPLPLSIGDIVHCEDMKDPAVVFHLEDSGENVLVACLTPWRSIDSGDGLRIDADDLTEGTLDRSYSLRVEKIATLRRALCRRVGHLCREKVDQTLREITAMVVRSHYRSIHRQETFARGRTRVPVAGRVYDDHELVNLVNASLDFWLTAGAYAERFEKGLAAFVGVRHCSLTNSGSSANLLAFMALTSPRLGERRIQKGDEVITVAAAFPTTVAPIVQFGAVPVFVDIELPTCNVDCSSLEQALSRRTKGVMLAHTLGNPFDVERVLSFCREHNLWLVEDCCDALGSSWTSPGGEEKARSAMVGTFGHLSTFSFYPAHHITMGEGGAVCTDDPVLKEIVDSFRDWGRDCSCPPGKDNCCGKRFSRQLGQLPFGYDHKYVYSHLGYNLKATEMQAAVGLAQLEKLRGFIEARKRNWRILRDRLQDLQEFLILPEPSPASDPSWFGFALTVREESGFSRDDLVRHLESKQVQTRVLFSGNILRHPCFDELRERPGAFRVAGPLEVTDRVMRDTFWIGVYPGLTQEMVAWMVDQIHSFFGKGSK